jgi:hypothetical protein
VGNEEDESGESSSQHSDVLFSQSHWDDSEVISPSAILLQRVARVSRLSLAYLRQAFDIHLPAPLM